MKQYQTIQVEIVLLLDSDIVRTSNKGNVELPEVPMDMFLE